MRIKDHNKILEVVTCKLFHSSKDSTDIPETNFNRLQLINIIKIYFDFAYYLCLTPFRLAQMENSNGQLYILQKWKPQQVVCCLSNILCIFFLMGSIRETIPEKHSNILKNPSVYFKMILACCAFFYKLVLMKRFWLNGHLYLNCVNTVIKGIQLPVNNRWLTKTSFLYSLYGFCVLRIVVSLITGYNFILDISQWTLKNWVKMLVVRGRFVFCFTSVSSLLDESKVLDNLTFADRLLAFLMLLSCLTRFIIAEFSDLYILIFVLTLWVPASSFAEDIKTQIKSADEQYFKSDSENDVPLATLRLDVSSTISQSDDQLWTKIYKNFQAIQNLSQVQNCAMGTLLTWYLAEGLMYYSINLNTLYVTGDVLNRFVKLGYFTSMFFNLYLSGNICSNMESAKLWLMKKDNIKSVPFDEAYLVMQDSITRNVGMRGSDYFTLTFGTIAAYLSLITTFFIICIQQNEF